MFSKGQKTIKQSSYNLWPFFDSSVLAGGVVALERYSVEVCGVQVQMSNYRICFYIFAGSMFFTILAALLYKFPVSTFK